MIELTSPMIITSRLMAGVTVGGATISITPSPRRDPLGKPIWTWYIDGDDFEAYGDDLAGWGDHREIMGSLLSFLSACGEGLAYRLRTNRESETEELFPPEVAEWAMQYSDEITMLQLEIEGE